MQGACRALQSFGAHSLCRRLPPLMPLFFFFFSLFPSVSRWYGPCFFTHNSRQFQSLEKILVQNIRVGLSPSFTEAIRSISRWKFVQSSLPHVMLCTAQLINERYKLDLLFNFFFLFPSLYLLKLRLFFFFFLKIEICGFPPQNAIAFISFLFFL